MLLAFGLAAVLGTVLLMLPVATDHGDSTDFVSALFTATSAVCITGLAVVDTGTHWSLFGELVVLGLIQAGGLGVMTLASLLGLLVSRRFGMQMELSAQRETKSLALGDVRSVVFGVLKLSLLFEAVIALALTVRLLLGHGYSLTWRCTRGPFTRSRRSTTPDSRSTTTG